MPENSRQSHLSFFGQIQEPKAGQEKMNLEQRKNAFEGIHLWRFRLTSCCFCSVSKLCLTLCNPMDYSTPTYPVLHYLRGLAQTHDHSVRDLILCHRLKLMTIEPVISSSVIPFSSCLQSFPASGSLPMSQLFTSGGQSIGASASVLPMDIQDWFPLGLNSLFSLLSKGLSRVFSSTIGL